MISIGPHSEVKGRNADPGRLIWNIETTDVKGEFERMKAAGATVVASRTASRAIPMPGSPPSPIPTTTTSSS